MQNHKIVCLCNVQFETGYLIISLIISLDSVYLLIVKMSLTMCLFFVKSVFAHLLFPC